MWYLVAALVIVILILVAIITGKDNQINEQYKTIKSYEDMLDKAETDNYRYKKQGYLPDVINKADAWAISPYKPYINRISIVFVKTSSEYDPSYHISNVFATRELAVEELIKRKTEELKKVEELNV